MLTGSLFDPPTPPTAPSINESATGSTRNQVRTPPEPMPPWLVRHLESGGHIDASKAGAIATRKARTVFCLHCRHAVMRGLLSMPTPWPVDVDLTPLTAEGEALALIVGVQTYEVHWRYNRYELDRRTAGRISMYPINADAKGFDVYPEHYCGQPAAWPTQDTHLVGGVMFEERDANLPIDPPF